MPPLSPLPGIDVEAALARLGGNHDALTSCSSASSTRKAARHRGAAPAGRPAAAPAGALHRLRGVAANLGAADVARLTADAEAVLHDRRRHAGHAIAEPAGTGAGTGHRTARNPCRRRKFHANTAPANWSKNWRSSSLLQNNNLKALEHFRALRPALASAEQAQAWRGGGNLNFKAARQMVEACCSERKVHELDRPGQERTHTGGDDAMENIQILHHALREEHECCSRWTASKPLQIAPTSNRT
jgi:hypothetical protein